MKLVHWPLIGGLLHLVQQGAERANLFNMSVAKVKIKEKRKKLINIKLESTRRAQTSAKARGNFSRARKDMGHLWRQPLMQA